MPPLAPPWPRWDDRYHFARILSIAAAGLGLLGSPAVQRGLPPRRRRAQYSAREPRAAHVARTRRSRPRGCHYSVDAANRSLQVENRPDNAPAKTAARPLCHPVGQAAPHAELCPELLRGTRRIHARSPADYAAIIKRSGQAQAVMISHPSKAFHSARSERANRRRAQ